MDNEIEVMRVLRVPPMGKLVVEVGGQRYEKLSDVTNPGLRQRLMTAVGELIVFSDGYKTLVDAGVAPPMMVEQRGTAKAEPVSASIEERRAAFLASLERERDALAVTVNKVPNPQHIIAAAVRDEPPAAKQAGIVDQIDEILQKHVASDPKLASRSIHLEQAPAGGLRINVDGQVYQRPAEIKEKEIQLVIKMALKEWEAV